MPVESPPRPKPEPKKPSLYERVLAQGITETSTHAELQQALDAVINEEERAAPLSPMLERWLRAR